MNTPTAPIPLDRPRMLSTTPASAVSTGSGSAYRTEHNAIALQANSEKLVTAGWVSNGSDNDFFIARHNLPAPFVASSLPFVPPCLRPASTHTGIGTARTIPSYPC